jgi:hypothetical protein
MYTQQLLLKKKDEAHFTSYDFLYPSSARTTVVTVLLALSSFQSEGIDLPWHVTCIVGWGRPLLVNTVIVTLISPTPCGIFLN